MNEKKTAGQRAADFLAGKGFYIVLLICAAVVAVSAWALFFAGEDDSNAVMGDAVEVNEIDVEAMGADNEPVYKPGKEPETTPTAEPTEKPAETPAASPAAAANEGDSKPVPTTEIQETNSTMESEPVEAASLSFVWPLSGNVQQPYSVDELLYNKTMADWRTHNGVDIAADMGAKVMAAADGTVKEAYSDEMYGTTIVIDHGAGLCSIYANLASTPTVAVGDSVSIGDVIGSVGDTAMAEVGEVSHLHYAMTLDGVSVDPNEYLPEKN